MKPLVIIDSDIPFIEGILEPYCEVLYLKGDKISNDHLLDADALIIRTRTKCDYDLLKGSKVKAIFTATIGTDHIDTDYCKINQISVFNAAGCNAYGVVQYVLTSIFALCRFHNSPANERKLGIIGAGNVGERLAQIADSIGFEVMRCDPPKRDRFLKGNPEPFFGYEKLNLKSYYELDELIAECGILSLHVPLNSMTSGMCSDEFFSKMKKGSIFINTSRGEVVNEASLLRYREQMGGVAIDVWRGEPEVNRYLLDSSDISTPHIAGYSLEGKVNATLFTIRNFSYYFNLDKLNNFNITPEKPIEQTFILDKNKSVNYNVYKILSERFDLLEESNRLKASPEDFEDFRIRYKYRREITGNDILSIQKLLL